MGMGCWLFYVDLICTLFFFKDLMLPNLKLKWLLNIVQQEIRFSMKCYEMKRNELSLCVLKSLLNFGFDFFGCLFVGRVLELSSATKSSF